MRFFFRSKQFKIILVVAVSLLLLSGISFAVGGVLSPQSNILGMLTAPLRTAATEIANSISDIGKAYKDGNKIMLENAQLESEINELREQLKDYEKAIGENEFYKEYLELKEANTDYKFASAKLISIDKDDPYKGFVINRGSLHSIEENDPVITSAGLVGYITEVGLTTSKVTTILSPELIAGALDNRTTDSGLLSGNLEFAEKGYAKFYNLSRSCNIAIGDYVVTSGEGIFPEGLLIGTIFSIGSDKYNTSIYAEVKPFVNLDEIRNVMVITNFDGQGGIIGQEDK